MDKISARSIPQAELPRPLEQYTGTAPSGMPMNYPGFGWEGYCVDRSVGTDSDEALQFCHDHGFIDHDTKTFFNTPLRAFCEQRGAKKCAALLKKLGYPQ